ncbi:MAG: hypothetical protein LBF95_01835 [Treponema sp.]|jgi:hypothetical protein|nr:hypothetical protein [Treponema sp.]
MPNIAAECLPAALRFAALWIWHSVMPLRNFVDGSQSLTGAIMTAFMLLGSSFLFSVQLGMQFKQASSLWDGMVVHFINNVSVNLIHVVSSDGVETSPTMRIAIAQTIMFIVVAVRYFGWKKTRGTVGHKEIVGFMIFSLKKP